MRKLFLNNSKAAPKRGKGRPAKGTEANAEKQKASGLKNTRYALLKNQRTFLMYKKIQLEFLTKANPRLYRATFLRNICVWYPKSALTRLPPCSGSE